MTELLQNHVTSSVNIEDCTQAEAFSHVTNLSEEDVKNGRNETVTHYTEESSTEAKRKRQTINPDEGLTAASATDTGFLSQQGLDLDLL